MSRPSRPSAFPAGQAGTLPLSLTHGFDIGEQIGSFGPELVWKIYAAVRHSDSEPVSIFIFEKKIAEKLHKPKRKGTITDLYKRGFNQLARIQNIRFLKVLQPVEETADTLIAITEPVMGSLSDLIRKGKANNSSLESQLLDLEIKCGIADITEALIYLHTTEHSMHGNVCPETILVAANGSWKLAGLEFVEKSSNRVDSFPSIRWSSKFPKLGQPNLNFIAPEVQLESQCSTTSDLFSLGMTICAVYNHGRSLLHSDHSSATYEQLLAQLDYHLQEFRVQMPSQLQEAVTSLLNRDPRQRQTAQLFSMTKCLNEPAITCLHRLDYLDHMFPSQKAEFFPALRDSLHSIPRKMWLSRVLPALTRDLSVEDQAAHALTPLCYMIEHSDKMDYIELYRPSVQAILMAANKPLETQIILLQNLPTFARLATKEEMNAQLIPLLESALQSTNYDLMEAGIQCFAKFYPILRDEPVKYHLFNSLKSLFRKSTASSIRAQPIIIATLEKILEHLGKTFVLEEILPILAEERLTFSANCANVLCDLYRQVFREARFALSPEHISRFVLPTLLPLLTHSDITKENYQQVEALCRDLFTHLEKKQRAKHKLDTPSSVPAISIPGPLSTCKLEAGSSSANNSRRSSMTGDRQVLKGTMNGGPNIVFTAGDSAHSSRSSSPGRGSRRSSFAPSTGAASTSPSRKTQGMFLNVGESGMNSRSRTSPATPERRRSFLELQALSGPISPTQRRHSAVSIQAIGSQMVSLFAGRT